MTDKKDLSDKVIAVTGASRGIGHAAALEAARRGAHVIAIARTQGGLEELDDEIKALDGASTLVPLDITDYAGIDRLGAAIFERWGRLDGLVGNAGMLGAITPVAHIDPELFDKVFAVNVTANFRFLRSFDLLLRKSEAGRAVFVSSGAAKSARPFWGLYASSKAALDTLVKAYAGEMERTTVRTNIFYPGIVRTRMRATAMPGEDPKTLPPPEAVAPALIDMVTPGYTENGMLFNAGDGSLTAL